MPGRRQSRKEASKPNVIFIIMCSCWILLSGRRRCAGKVAGCWPPRSCFLKDLCEAACEGLPERPHEVKKCADKDIKQFYVSKQLNSEESRTKESAPTAKQSVGDLEGTNFDTSSKLWLWRQKASSCCWPTRKPAMATKRQRWLTVRLWGQRLKSSTLLLTKVQKRQVLLWVQLCTWSRSWKMSPLPQLKSSSEELKKLEADGTEWLPAEAVSRSPWKSQRWLKACAASSTVFKKNASKPPRPWTSVSPIPDCGQRMQLRSENILKAPCHRNGWGLDCTSRRTEPEMAAGEIPATAWLQTLQKSKTVLVFRGEKGKDTCRACEYIFINIYLSCRFVVRVLRI